MREILFRGKWFGNDEWVVGALYSYYDFQRTIVQILTDRTNGIPDAYEVYPETVGQYTGLTDKNGKKIFEGDIVTMGNGLLWTVGFDLNAFVAMDGRTVQFALFEQYEWDHKTKKPIAPDYFEVIGNIHDNPELLNAQ